ncbi:MAG: efflux RND transporter periplasmic adaptor subunit [Chroococcidiopsidaceae cyanobacterium CP_BM_RX_35]|nr:efflux RND transporter periplasmic adaptor subunit [Chroococcidiopsidaceae cyanobacterium CP_BM_RX_35]
MLKNRRLEDEVSEKIFTGVPEDASYALTRFKFVKDFGKNRITRLLLGLIILGLAAGGGLTTYRQVILTPRLEARRRAQTVPVERVSIPVTVSANGTVQPERSTNISPKTAGLLKSRLVDAGDQVKQGQVLARMDDSDLLGQLTQYRGQLASAQANLEKLINGNRPEDIAQAEAQLRDKQATLRQNEANLAQNLQLYRTGALAFRDYNNSLAARDSARAQVVQVEQALAEQRKGSRVEDIAQARAQVLTAQGQVQTIQTQIDDTVLRAPFSGVVTAKYADPGAFVTPTTSGSSVSSATSSSIMSIAANNQIVAQVAESNIAQIHLGQTATIRADAYPGKTFKGRVVQIAPQSTVTQNVTSFEVKLAILDDPHNLLRSGMNADVEFNAGTLQSALVVPTVAVVRQDNGTGVLVDRGQQPPTFTPIMTGVTVNDKTQVLSGLTGTERVFVTFPEGTKPTTNGPSFFSSPRQGRH